METTQSTEQNNNGPKHRRLILKQFNWRMILVRVFINALTLIIIVFLLPGIDFVDRFSGSILFLAAVLGLLNAFVKPVVQFLTLPYIFATFGSVVVVINTIMLLFLAWLFPSLFAINGILWAILGGVLMGILAGFLESLFGLDLPIVSIDDQQEEGADRPVNRPASFEDLLVDGVIGNEEVQKKVDAVEAPPLANETQTDPQISLVEQELTETESDTDSEVQGEDR